MAPNDAQRRREDAQRNADDASVRGGEAVRPSELGMAHSRGGRVADRVRHGLRALGGLRGRGR